MLAFALLAALGCLILLLFLAEKCLKLERFQVSLSRSRFAQSAAQRVPWGSIPFRVRRPLRAYGVRSAARPRLAFACAFLWVALLAPGVAFLRWRPERAFRAQPWLWSSSRLAQAEDFGDRLFESALDELEVLMHPKAGSTILAAERLDGLVNVHNAVTGAEVYVNGERYEGFWKDDKADGKGTLTYIHGDKYVGEWVAAKKQGQGELYYANGDMFRGEWVQDRASGTGVLMYANNNRYEGQWLDDRRHGTGTFFHADGSRYEGEWASGRKEGKGTLYFNNGDSFTGYWSEGSISGQGFLSLHEESPWNIPDL